MTNLLLAVSFLLFLSSSQLYAANLTVGPGQGFSTITAGLAAAVSGDTVQIYPNPPNDYHENIALKSGVVVKGVETARTKIVGTGTGYTVTAASNSTIMNLTIVNPNTASGSAAILISGVTGATVTNNLILGSNTGIACASSSNLIITNNTVDGNATGVLCSGSIIGMTFENNIVSNNTLKGMNFSGALVTTSTINYNDTYNNGPNSYTAGPNDFNLDPKYVAPAINDYHLQTGSACLDAGDPAVSFNDKVVSTAPVDHSRNDCGAYGGPQRDTTPFQVQNIVATGGTNSIALTWNANLAYDIANYKLYFDNQSHTITNDVPTPAYQNTLTVPSTATNCPSSPAPPTCSTTVSITLAAPANLQVGFGDQELFLSWSPASGINIATGYNVYFKQDTASAWNKISAGNVTAYTLTGLTNLTRYDVYVTAVASSMYFINVTAQDDYTTPHESSLLSPDINILINGGAAIESPPSATVSNYPEKLAPFPDLPNRGGCFIATAAYGSYSEPRVRLLRVFRDEYLNPYHWGRRFVGWYYRISPPWAQYLNEHVWLKPVVRAGLTPAVGVAYFFVVMNGFERSLILLSGMICLAGGIVVMKRAKRRRD